MSDKLAEIQGGISEAGSELATWRSLMEHPAWKELTKYGQEQFNLRASGVLRSPLQSADGAFAQEFVKGEGSGIEMILNLPGTKVEELRIEVEKLRVMEEREKDAVQAEKSVDESRVDSSEFIRDA